MCRWGEIHVARHVLQQNALLCGPTWTVYACLSIIHGLCAVLRIVIILILVLCISLSYAAKHPIICSGLVTLWIWLLTHLYSYPVHRLSQFYLMNDIIHVYMLYISIRLLQTGVAWTLGQGCEIWRFAEPDGRLIENKCLDVWRWQEGAFDLRLIHKMSLTHFDCIEQRIAIKSSGFPCNSTFGTGIPGFSPVAFIHSDHWSEYGL